jgi:hypothetical protein
MQGECAELVTNVRELEPRNSRLIRFLNVEEEGLDKML